MAITQSHELHRRRWSRNVGVALTLVAFIAVVFGLTVAKIRQGSLMEGFDHQPRASALPPIEEGQ